MLAAVRIQRNLRDRTDAFNKDQSHAPVRMLSSGLTQGAQSSPVPQVPCERNPFWNASVTMQSGTQPPGTAGNGATAAMHVGNFWSGFCARVVGTHFSGSLASAPAQVSPGAALAIDPAMLSGTQVPRLVQHLANTLAGSLVSGPQPASQAPVFSPEIGS